MNTALQHIYIYPLKSSAPQSLSSAEILQDGIRGDRIFALVNNNNELITAREKPILASLYIAESSNKITIEYLGQLFSFELSLGQSLDVKLFDAEFSASLISVSASKWFSELIGQACSLVKNNALQTRKIKAKYEIKGGELRMSDAAPILLINSESVSELNSKMENAIDGIQFRPNLIISGFKAGDEYTWKQIQIGKIKFRVMAACKRCKLSTLNYHDYTFHPTQEPLRSLSTYSKDKHGKVVFGIYLFPMNSGVLDIGDSIKVFY